jgi:hypothetical protein|tara:strand:- start:16 stop:183 length:168 start_codon:yes stop_codon:yes gene_type:complete
MLALPCSSAVSLAYSTNYNQIKVPVMFLFYTATAEYKPIVAAAVPGSTSGDTPVY